MVYLESKSKKIRKRLTLVFAVSFFIVSTAVPFFLWYLPKQRFQVMGDIEVFGFNTYGWMSIENAVGRRFAFIGGNYNVSIPSGDCQIESLKVIKGQERGSAFYDTIIFNATGKLDIKAINVSFFFCNTLGQNSTGIMRFVSEGVQSFLPHSGYPSTEIVFWLKSNASKTLSISLLEGSRRELSLDFGADNGSLSITGSQNFTLPLERDRAGVLLTVSVPLNRGYTTQVNGDPNQVYVDNWERVSMVFLEGTPNVNSFEAFYPKGELAFNGRSYKALGSQDMNFTSFRGVVHILPSSNPNLFRILIGGRIESILCESAERTTNITEKSYLDILFPFPISGISLLIGISIWYIWHPRTDKTLIPPTIAFFLGSLIWAIKTEQPLWMQNLFGYAPLFVTVMIYLAEQRKGRTRENHNISKPDKNEKKEETEKPKAGEERIEDLASFVDSRYQHRKWSIKRICIWGVLQILAVSIIIYIIFVLSPYITEPTIYVSFYLGTVAIFVAVNTSIKIQFQMTSQEVTRWNYERLKEKTEAEQPLLRALIKMKNRQPDLPLTEIIKECPSLFERKKLLETLYE